ncbi:MAG: thiol-disulfide oxidoreductase DCC family protein [Bacteroidales bacterium]|nr:thiol-disulfide oxidoreductase DCC family protein [Bacteroidales bacterium]MBN2756325.1 thiol-disulfide oxidoreductase DCC family protein [Bacteroidales bacterium]
MIVIFDGICNFCESSVIFIINRDRKSKFKFVQAQSEIGINLQLKFGVNSIKSETIILIKKDKVFYKSNAALEIAKNLDSFWPMLYIFKIIPSFFRDKIYDYIAKNRYKWFGKKNACMIPTTSIKTRFL